MLQRFIFTILFIISIVFTMNLNAQLNIVIENWKAHKDLKNATIGFCVMDAKTSEIISEYNAHQFLIPASTLKVVTTGAALAILGNDYRFETTLFHTGVFDKKSGIISGDLIVYGHGDPTLQSEYFFKDTLQITDKWAAVLKTKGVKEIKGRIIGDATYFDRSIPGTWIWSDISNYFGAAPNALSYNDNKFKITFNSKKSGEKAEIIKISPEYLNSTIIINSNVVAKGTEDEAFVYGDPFSYSKEVTGKIPPNQNNFEVEATLPDPALLCAEMLYTSMIKIGIKCNSESIQSLYRKSDSTTTRTSIYTYSSPPLEKIVYYTNLKSNNHYCESMLRALGKGNVNTGLETVKKYWQKKGLDVTELFMVDGSGLSRANTLTANFQASLLSKIYNDSIVYKPFNNSLPIAGKSGSMSNIGRAKSIENNMRAKTGYINRARGYCGYVKGKSGKELAFSVLFNNYNCNAKEAKINIEKFLIELGEL